MELDFTQLIISVVYILFAIIGGLITKNILPWLREKNLENAAIALVRVAYTLFKDNQGVEKFNYVLSNLLKKYGKYFNEAELSLAIQNAYVQFKESMGQEVSPTTPILAKVIKQ